MQQDYTATLVLVFHEKHPRYAGIYWYLFDREKVSENTATLLETFRKNSWQTLVTYNINPAILDPITVPPDVDSCELGDYTLTLADMCSAWGQIVDGTRAFVCPLKHVTIEETIVLNV